MPKLKLLILDANVVIRRHELNLWQIVTAKCEVADSIVYKVLGNLNMAEQGISLEEILQKIGHGLADSPWQYSKAFREKWTQAGQRDAITGLGDQSSR